MHVLLISGSTRSGSSNTRALLKLQSLDHPGVTTELYDGLTQLPAFVPAQEPIPPQAADLLDRVATADAVVFSTPEYAGGLPGTLKNLLDWTVGGGQLYEKPVAWLDVANAGRGAGARNQLRSVLGYVGAHIIESACLHVALDAANDRQTAGGDGDLAVAQAALIAAVGEGHHVAEA